MCGLTTTEQCEWAIEQGVDWVGFVLAESKRKVDLRIARQMIGHLNRRCVCVAVTFADDPFEANQIEDCGFDLWQIHRCERVQKSRFLDSRLPCIRAESFSQGMELEKLDLPFRAHLLDAPHPGAGQAWDWSKLTGKLQTKFLLAGGLTPENVVQAIQDVRPWGVDVSSGVESSPGIKCREKMRQFVERAREAFASNS